MYQELVRKVLGSFASIIRYDIRGGTPRELSDFIFRFSRGGGESVFNQNNSLPTKILAWEANLMKTILRQPKSRVEDRVGWGRVV